MGKQVIKGINDLKTTHPSLVLEWHPKYNDTLQPDEVSAGSNKKVFWKCSKCNHEWQATINNRAKQKRGCPCCANKVVVKGKNDLATTHPQIAKEWYQPLNGEITPFDVTHGSGKKYYWTCSRGHVYSASVLHRTSGIGTNCPICNSGRHTSFAEQALYYYVKILFEDAINGYKTIFEKGMELDIYIPSMQLAIEYDGVYWHNKKSKSREREQRKYDICMQHGIKLIRIREHGNEDDELIPADKVFISQRDLGVNKALNDIIIEVLTYICHTNTNFYYKEQLIDIDVVRDRFSILSYLKGPINNSLQQIAPELVVEWDYEKNGNINPEMISAGSSLLVNWICSKCGYKWETTIAHRAKEKTGCPKCLGLVFEEGINDLETKFPEILIDWDYEENAKNNIFPNKIKYNSGKTVKWICHICGHKWEIGINARTVHGNGCIVCGYKKGKELKRRNLINAQGSITDELLLKEWNYEKNSELGDKPCDFVPGSTKSVFWKCSVCGHEWKAPIARRNKGAGCRKCADRNIADLKRKASIAMGHIINNSLLFEEWDKSMNEKELNYYSYGSNYKGFWKCRKCGYSWCATINSRWKGAGCPACAGNIVISGKNDLKTKYPNIALDVV